MGEWTQQTQSAWVYHVPQRTLPYAYVLRQREDGPTGAAWDALLVGRGIDKDVVLLERVSLEAAKAAVERAAERRPRPQSSTPSRRHRPPWKRI